MNLHVEVTGQGDSLVMLHGWGMHSGIWGDAAVKLANHFQLHCVDLPGHGNSNVGNEQEVVLPFTLDAIVEQLSERFDQPITVCGWSLGGQIALYWAMLEPEKVKRLVLVTSTPCFAVRTDWQFGMHQDTLRKFAAELEIDTAATLRRFLALQVRGSLGERELLKMLRERLLSRKEPMLEALRGGLQILRDADLRAILPGIKQPALVIAGERDKLSPPQASHYLAQAIPNGHVVEIKGAAHVPFLTHQIEFVKLVADFMDEKLA